MGRDSELLNRIRTALAPIPDVEEKRMFGSAAFMVRGKMCISARPERIMCRIDPAVRLLDGYRREAVSSASAGPVSAA